MLVVLLPVTVKVRQVVIFTVKLIVGLVPLSSARSFRKAGAASYLFGHGEHRPSGQQGFPN